MKPASFRYHAPKTLDEAVAILAEVAPQDGRVLAGGQSLVPIMAFRLARPAHLVDINEVAGLDRLGVEDGTAVDRRARAPCRVSQAVVRRTARQAAVLGRPPHRALSDPHARHVLRQPRACRSGVGMVPGRGDARCRDRRGKPRGERVIAAKDFFEGIMATSLARTSCWPKCGCRCCRKTPIRLQRIQPPRRRFRHRDGAGHLPACGRQDRRAARRRRRRRVAAAAHRRSGSGAQRDSRRATSLPRRGGSGRRTRSIRWWTSGRRRIPARSGARRRPPRAGARRGMRVHTKSTGTKWVGRSIRRLEDPALVRARALHRRSAGGALGAFCAKPGGRREDQEHQAPPDGAMVITAADLRASSRSRRCCTSSITCRSASRSLPTGVVRFIGEPVAAVVAASEEEAEDIVDLVELEIEESRRWSMRGTRSRKARRASMRRRRPMSSSRAG